MVPSTFVGLLLWVVLLIPGFVFALRLERSGPERQLSVLRETVALVFVSVICDLIVLSLAGSLWALIPGGVDLHGLVADPAFYVREHYVSLWWWAAGLLLAASLLSLLAAGPLTRWIRNRRGGRWHEPFLSAWARLFTAHPDCRVFVGCILEDGSYVAGWLHTYSRAGADSPDRELTLRGPLQYRPAGEAEAAELPGVGSASVSARQLATLLVSYIPISTASEPSGTASPTNQ